MTAFGFESTALEVVEGIDRREAIGQGQRVEEVHVSFAFRSAAPV